METGSVMGSSLGAPVVIRQASQGIDSTARIGLAAPDGTLGQLHQPRLVVTRSARVGGLCVRYSPERAFTALGVVVLRRSRYAQEPPFGRRQPRRRRRACPASAGSSNEGTCMFAVRSSKLALAVAGAVLMIGVTAGPAAARQGGHRHGDR